jgi:hypothetical protein
MGIQQNIPWLLASGLIINVTAGMVSDPGIGMPLYPGICLGWYPVILLWNGSGVPLEPRINTTQFPSIPTELSIVPPVPWSP